MNDFLHQLRQSKDKHFDRGRRPHSNPQYRDQDRRGGKDYRKPHTNRNNQDIANILEPTLSSIQNVLKEIQEHMKNLTTIEERRVKAEERKTDVLEKISERLMLLAENTFSNKPTTRVETMVETQPEPVVQTPAVQPESLPEPDPANLSREEILVKIAAHRKESMSYERIARELESAGIPTLSGKGRWRGQTVHKLLKQIES